MTLKHQLAKLLGHPSWRRECPRRGEFPLGEAEAFVWKFERPSLSTAQKFRFKKRKGYFSAATN
ncbi:MAG: hypothetical protein DRG25_06840 [Deltaproteobacteria bacterium]|nr:MAG: hypothetical protein DRG25_06840 [Deltaproteobacteria bacterium]